MLVYSRSAFAAQINNMTANLYKMLSIAEANQIVQESISPLEAVDIDLLSASGYVLASDVTAQDPLPPFPASIKVIISCWRSFSKSTTVQVKDLTR